MSNGLDLGLMIALGKSIITESQFADFPTNGNENRLYIDASSDNIYRWNGSGYTLVSSVSGGLTFLGTYDALNNVPAISSGSGTEGNFYIVSVGSSNISPAIDGITELSVGDEVIAQAKVGGGTEWVRIPAINAVVPPVFISIDTTLNVLDGTYIVTANGGDVTLTIPANDPSNEGRFFRIVKQAGDSSIIIVPQSPDTTFLDGRTSYTINNISEGITIYQSGVLNGGIIIQDSRSDKPVTQVEFLGDGNTESLQNTNWLLDVEGILFKGFRRSNDTWVEIFSFGNSLSTDRVILTSPSGSLSFIDALSTRNSIVKPSIDTSGVVLGNPEGRVACIYNGELFAVKFDTTSVQVDNVQLSTAEFQTGTEFQTDFVSSRVQAFINFDISLTNVPADTTARFFLEDSNGTIIAENVSLFDFEQGNGTSISTGINNLVFDGQFPIEQGFQFTAKLQTSNTVDLQGLTTDLGDGLGTRFVPYLVLRYYAGVEQDIITNTEFNPISPNLTEFATQVQDDGRLQTDDSVDTYNHVIQDDFNTDDFNVDGGTGEITLVDKEYGQLILNTPAPTNLGAPLTDTPISGTFVKGEITLNGFTLSTNGTLTYNGGGGVFKVDGTSDLQSDKNGTVTYKLFRNGVVVPNAITPYTFPSANSYESISITGIINASNGDTFRIYANSTTNNTTINVNTLSFNLVEI